MLLSDVTIAKKYFMSRSKRILCLKIFKNMHKYKI